VCRSYIAFHLVHAVSNTNEPTADGYEVETLRVCALLESIAANYPENSPESHALQDAANAYILVQQRQSLQHAFQKLKAARNGQLTDEMITDLRQHGIDPDELEDEI